MSKQVFINLPVKDLDKAIDFYQAIGFTINPQFTDDTAACMIWSEEIFVMLLTHGKIQEFTSKQIVDAKKYVGAIHCLSMESPDYMNEMADIAISKGGIEPDEPRDYGFMQQRSFEDLDGNHWEVMHFDRSQFPKEEV